MRSVPVYALIVCSLFCGTSEGSQKEGQPVITLADYKSFDWQRKVKYFSERPTGPKLPEEHSIYRFALESDQPVIKGEALKNLATVRLKDYRKPVKKLIEHENQIVRWRSLLFLESIPTQDDELPLVVARIRDSEWLAREAAFRSLRRYGFERKAKKHYFSVLLSLNERNPQVLRQIYQTMRWYKDSRTFPYLYKRSFHAQHASELMVIIEELAPYRNRKVRRRLYQLARSHSKMVVRRKAKQLLAEF